jgi:alpha-L-rhamnosidase
MESRNEQPREAAGNLLNPQWITFSTHDAKVYAIYHFRKTFTLKTKPDKFSINISADNGYKLYINGYFINSGPVIGTPSQWYFDTFELSTYLTSGANVIAVLVYNMGDYIARSQFSVNTALMVRGVSDAAKIVNTGKDWKVTKSEAYCPCSLNTSRRLNAYMAIGPGDEIDGRLYAWNWELVKYDDRSWKQADIIPTNDPILVEDFTGRWNLIPRPIPLLTQGRAEFKSVRRWKDLQKNIHFTSGKKSIKIPAFTETSVLLDMNEIVVAYPELTISSGKDASIKLTYAEALFDEFGKKGNRNDIDGKQIYGHYDIFHSDGGFKRLYKPLCFRTYRYLQIDVITKEYALTLNNIFNALTGYPYLINATFECNEPQLSNIWETGIRTVRLCAGDMFYDTPYYEQLQYVADSRIQALIMLYLSGDGRLTKKCILDFYNSKLPEGLLQSRYPCIKLQVIPAFSLFWISMVYDYWMHRSDDSFVKLMLPAVNDILEWFHRKTAVNGMLGPLPWWNFVDWDNFDSMGIAPGSKDGHSSIITLHYTHTLLLAAELFEHYNNLAIAKIYRTRSIILSQSTYKACYDKRMGLIADTPDRTTYSQHANIWGILSNAIPQSDRQTVMNRIFRNKAIGQVTYFYRFYLTRAIVHCDMADLYYSELTPWHDMINLGLTTFAEKPEPTRSDCHGWSASPNYEFLATICGIKPLTPGFNSILIQPALGELQMVKAKMPHPKGMIEVELTRTGKTGVAADIKIPPGVSGIFIWNGSQKPLLFSRQSFIIPN